MLIFSFIFFRYSEFGDVNISALLNSFQMGYDKRVRPNYGGENYAKARKKNYHGKVSDQNVWENLVTYNTHLTKSPFECHLM